MKILFKISMLITFMLSFSVLEAKIFTQEAVYRMGDDDSKSTAREKAISKAKKDSLEQAGVNITSYSKSIKGMLEDDFVESFSSTIIKFKFILI